MQKEDLMHPSHRSEDHRLKNTGLCISGRDRDDRHEVNCGATLLTWDSTSAFENITPCEGPQSRVAKWIEPKRGTQARHTTEFWHKAEAWKFHATDSPTRKQTAGEVEGQHVRWENSHLVFSSACRQIECSPPDNLVWPINFSTFLDFYKDSVSNVITAIWI